jgi:hypothetical protein
MPTAAQMNETLSQACRAGFVLPLMLEIIFERHSQKDHGQGKENK